MNTWTQTKFQQANRVYSTRGIHYWSYFRVVSDFSGGRSDLNPNIQYFKILREIRTGFGLTALVLMVPGELSNKFGFGGQRGQKSNKIEK